MTLLVAIGNPRWTVVVSDGRLSIDGRAPEDEHTKATIVWSNGARSVAAYTGLARAGTFRTDEWLLGALDSSMAPAGVLDLSKLAAAASSAVAALRIPEARKNLTVVLAGYVADTAHTYPSFGWVSNFEAPTGLSLTYSPGETFGQVFMRHTVPDAFEASYVIVAGTSSALEMAARDRLRRMAVENRPASAVRDKAVELIRQAADSPLSTGAVGKQCVSVILPSEPGEPPKSGYHSTEPVTTIRLPNMVAPGVQAIDARLEISGAPIFAGVGRNQPCPCGSRRKYKKCHGRR